MLLGCGGGGSSGGSAPPPTSNPPPPPAAPPFGLTTRPALASFSFPQSGGQIGAVSTTNAYPNLSFSSVLFAAPVPGENRLAAIEQSGRLLAFEDDPAVTNLELILDLTATVLFAGEQGLLGLAFDPDFVTNRYLYVHYSRDTPRRSIISRFTWDAATDRVAPASEKIILENPQPFSNHNGGMLAFGPDDYLYIAFGDGGSSGDPNNEAQNRSTLHGNILRIDVHPTDPNDPYDVPPDNPFIGEAGVLPEIYAYGLRNPFRFSFDSQTGDLWLGDVGQNTIEEIDIITSGANYGWRVFEGTSPFDDTGNTLPTSAFTPPVFEYPHTEGRSVIAGYVYRGSRLPDLVGKFVYGDFVAGRTWALTWDGTNVTQQTLLASVNQPTGFAEKTDGEVLAISRNGGLFQFDITGPGGSVPTLLSETGLFTNLATLTPAVGLIEYGVNQPFYSDGATKRRWIGVPTPSTIAFSDDDWNLPTDSITVKHFEIDTPSGTRRLETRVLINRPDGWQGFTYRWNSAGDDADLLLGRELETIRVRLPDGSERDQTYEYPSRTDCFVCHTDVAGVSLGLRTLQLNRDFDYSGVTDNQLRSLNNITLFDRDIGDAANYAAFPALDETTAPLADRARAYLDINCAQCHQPGGPTQSTLDLRVQTANAATNAIDVAPSLGNLGLSDPRIIAPGDRSRSVLFERMNRRGPAQMPPLGSHVVDAEGVALIGDWIDSL